MWLPLSDAVEPHPGEGEKRYCLLVTHSGPMTTDSDTPMVCFNESCESCCYFWSIGFL